MSEQHCSDCQHYVQHYTFIKERIMQVYCGHCTVNRPRKKHPDAKACEQFVPGPSQKDSFVSKEYLTKELLQYMLRLELFPEIDKPGHE